MIPRSRILSVFILGLVLSACGGPPAANQLLIDARTTFETIQRDPVVLTNAPVALAVAEEYLQQGEALWKEKGDVEEIEHYAYLARQRSLIAEQMAKTNQAEEMVEKAEAERQRVLLEARTAEAEKAEREAIIARQEAEDALAQVQQLSDQMKELEAQQTERGLVLTLSSVLFDVGKATLKPGSESMLRELTNFMSQYPERNVLIEGFTDNSGSRAFNDDLSLNRAMTVRNALTSRGISMNRIQVRGYGEQYPVASNATAYGRQQNRRVEIIISDERGSIPARTN